MVFKWLAQDLQRGLPKFWQLIEKEDTAMRQADLARTWEAPAAD
jgi:hypothetical protein